MFAEIIVQTDAPGLKQPFSYSIPDDLNVDVGDAVLVPFGATTLVGYLVGLKSSVPEELAPKIKPISARIADASAFDHELYELVRWVADEYMCDIQDTIKLIAPEVMTSQIRASYSLGADWESKLHGTRSEIQREIVSIIAMSGSSSSAKIAAMVSRPNVAPALAELRKKGIVVEERTLVKPQSRQKTVRVLQLTCSEEMARTQLPALERSAPKQAILLQALLQIPAAQPGIPAGLTVHSTAQSAAKGLITKSLAAFVDIAARRDPFPLFGAPLSGPPELSAHQKIAVRDIGRHVAAQDARTVLLHGVTGSGKTEVYLHLVAQAIALGKSAIIVLPEIGLTAQLLDLFKARFGGDAVAVLHSKLSLGERHDEWRRIRSGEARVVLGARSGIFAPARNIGLIVLDEEHDGSFKQDNNPRYHARNVAIKRSQMTGAPVVLGSATPMLESFYLAQTGVYELVSLPERIDNRPLPTVRIVDLREEFGHKPRAVRDHSPSQQVSDPPPPSIFSSLLTEALQARIDRGEQSILFLNRRGFASFLLCRDCGYTYTCENCAASMTFHSAIAILQCHHCDSRIPAPDLCPKCNGRRIRPFGPGTEKVQEAAAQQFPTARILRMDRDTMGRKGAHADALRGFRRGDFDILIGTQIVAKGLDFPNVTLVGVITADIALNMPDFRAAERTFQLLTQVAGRAGRGTVPGEVVVQTFAPQNPSILRAAEHDYLGFYNTAIEERRSPVYPPFVALANMVFSSEENRLARQSCENLASYLRKAASNAGAQADVLGPSPCPLSKLKTKYRWHLLFRAPERSVVRELLNKAVEMLLPAERQALSIDIDPLTML